MIWKEKYILLIICIFLFLSYSIYYLSKLNYSDTAFFGGDTWEYQSIAVNLKEGKGYKFGGLFPYEYYKFDDHYGEPNNSGTEGYKTWTLAGEKGGENDFYRTPGYTIFLATIYKIFGIHPQIAKQAQLLLLTTIASFLPLIGYFYWKKIGYFSSIIAGAVFINQYNFSLSWEILTEPLIAFSIFILIFSYIFCEKYKKNIYYLIFGSICGLNLLVKGSTIFVIPLFLIYFFYQNIRRKLEISKILFFILGTILIIAPWSTYISIKLNKPTFISTQGNIVILEGNNEFTKDGNWHPEGCTFNRETNKWYPACTSYPDNFYNHDNIKNLPIFIKLPAFYYYYADMVPDMMLNKIKLGFNNFIYLKISIICYFLLLIINKIKRISIPKIPISILIIFINYLVLTLLTFGLSRFIMVIDFIFIFIAISLIFQIIQSLLKPQKIKKINFYHQDLLNFYKQNIDKNSTILDINHGNNYHYKSLSPKLYKSVNILKNKKIPQKLKFEYIIISDTLSITKDIQTLFHKLKNSAKPETRIIINYHNYLWLPLLNIAEKLKIKLPQKRTNWLNTDDIVNLLEIENLQVIKHGHRLLIPIYIPVISSLFNKYLANLPIINNLCFTNYIIARSNSHNLKDKSVSIVIPARNEEGNIENAIKKIPKFGKHQEIIFIEGGSTDDTWDKIQFCIKKYPKIDIKAYHQKKRGKADAVREGFAHATGEILIILDADLTVDPTELVKFYNAIASNKGEYINGCRLVYPMEKESMQYLNILGNHFFSKAFSWILNQKIKDTLCGTKVLSKNNYNKIAKNRKYFGDFDPFGDFDLLFGASKLNLKFIEIPVHYKAREYGQTNISRFKHGWLLIKMVFFALGKIKFI